MEDTSYHLRCVAYVDQLNNATHSQYSQRVSKLLPSPESIKQWMHKTNSQLDLWIRIPFRFPRWFDFGLSPISRSTDFNIVFDFFFYFLHLKWLAMIWLWFSICLNFIWFCLRPSDNIFARRNVEWRGSIGSRFNPASHFQKHFIQGKQCKNNVVDSAATASSFERLIIVRKGDKSHSLRSTVASNWKPELL